MYPYQCEGCQATLKLKDQHLGRKIKCPKCETVFRVPEDLAKVGIVEAELVEAPASEADDFFSDLDNYYPSNQGYAAPPTASYAQQSPAYAGGQNWNSGPQTVVKRKKKKRKSNSAMASVDLHTVGFGVFMMVGAVVWFVGGLFAGLIFFYPPFLFIVGLITMVKGFFSS